jgi:hypothetical protein
LKMKLLETDLRHGGFDLDQVFREGVVAVYEQSKYGHVMAYEVVRIRVRRAELSPRGTPLPTREVYPCNEDWGTDGFTCLTLESAMTKAKQMAQITPPRPPASDSDASGVSL